MCLHIPICGLARRVWNSPCCIWVSENKKTRQDSKHNLLMRYPDECQEQSNGESPFLVFNEGLQNLSKGFKSSNFGKDALSMVHVAKVVQKEMFKTEFPRFSGSYSWLPGQCSAETSIKVLLSMLLCGSNMKDQNVAYSLAFPTVCQLTRLNSKEKAKGADKPRHQKDKAFPLPLYLGLNVHSQTQNKTLFNQLHELGLSKSYRQVLELEDISFHK